MKRRNFFKSLATFIAAPSIIESVGIEKPKPYGVRSFDMLKSELNIYEGTTVLTSGNRLFNDLNKLTPRYYETMVQKYGDSEILTWVEKPQPQVK